MDHCIVDTRLPLHNLENNKLKTAHFESDHKAIICSIDTHDLAIQQASPKHRFMYKKTKWEKFRKNLDLKDLSIPLNKNSSNQEIDDIIEKITNNITDSIEKIVPKYEPSTDTLLYMNSKIKTLKSNKSRLLTLLNKCKKEKNKYPTLIESLQEKIKEIADEIKSEFKKSYTKHWDTVRKNINYKDSNDFFPKINRIYRPKPQLEIDTLHIKKTDNQLLGNINKTGLEEENDHYIIEKPADKITVMVNFYQKINTPRHTNHNTPIRRIVLQKTAKYKEENALRKLSKSTTVVFSDNNPANNPISTDKEI